MSLKSIKTFLLSTTALLAVGASAQNFRHENIDVNPSRRQIDLIGVSRDTVVIGATNKVPNNGVSLEGYGFHTYSLFENQTLPLLSGVSPTAISSAGNHIYGSYRPNNYNLHYGYLDVASNLWKRTGPFTDVFDGNGQNMIGVYFGSGSLNVHYYLTKYSGITTTLLEHYRGTDVPLAVSDPLAVSNNKLVLIGYSYDIHSNTPPYSLHAVKAAVKNIDTGHTISLPTGYGYNYPRDLGVKYLMAKNGDIVANSKVESPSRPQDRPFYYKYKIGAGNGGTMNWRDWYDAHPINMGNYSLVTITSHNGNEMVGLAEKRISPNQVDTHEVYWKSPDAAPIFLGKSLSRQPEVSGNPYTRRGTIYSGPKPLLPCITEVAPGMPTGKILRRLVTPGGRNILEVLTPLGGDNRPMASISQERLQAPIGARPML